MKNQDWHTLDRIEKLARGSLMGRLLHNPLKYITAIAFWRLIYPLTHKGRLTKARTFFGNDMEVILPSATEIYLFGAKTHDSEIRLARFMLKTLQPGDTFCDVGAHFGYFTLLAAYLTGPEGKVCSFEASRSNYAILKKNTLSAPTVSTFFRAVSDSDASMTFFEFPALYSEYNSLVLPESGSAGWMNKVAPEQIEVQGIRLDDFFNTHRFFPGMIKIDVEGAEEKVLHGMKDYLAKSRPTLIMEYLTGTSQVEAYRSAVQSARHAGFQTYIINNEGDPENCKDVEQAMKDRGRSSDNILFMKHDSSRIFP